MAALIKRERSPERHEYPGKKPKLFENHGIQILQFHDFQFDHSEESLSPFNPGPSRGAGFSITEPSYDFKNLESPCTITSGSSLAAGVEKHTQDSSSGHDTSDDVSNSTTSSWDRIRSNTLNSFSFDAVQDYGQMQSEPGSSSAHLLNHHRQLRKKRKIFTSEECPVCGVTVRQQDIEDHYRNELKKLDSLKKKLKKPRKKLSFINKKLEQVQANRAKRSRYRGPKQMKDVGISTCLVCHPQLLDDESVVRAHAVLHLTECVGVGDDLLEEALLEYPIAAGNAMRIINLDPIFSMSYNRIENAEEDSPVTVDDDDDIAEYGSPQFSEQDLIVCVSSLTDASQSALREAVLSSSSSDDDMPPLLDLQSDEIGFSTSTTSDCILYPGASTSGTDGKKLQEDNQAISSSTVVLALKTRIEELEEQLQNKSASKCNICLENYKEPLVSVGCWHVCCRICWLKTLGARKLCPQCSKITLPSSLRRIYL